jgi:hypothetical protein
MLKPSLNKISEPHLQILGPQKLPEIRQKDNESVIKYVSRCGEILLELNRKTDGLEVKMQLQLTTELTATHNINEVLRVRITREIKMKTQAVTFNLIIHLIARFKAEIITWTNENRRISHNHCPDQSRSHAD